MSPYRKQYVKVEQYSNYKKPGINAYRSVPNRTMVVEDERQLSPIQDELLLTKPSVSIASATPPPMEVVFEITP